MLVTRVARETAGVVGTEDGYLYRWPKGGEAVDVLPHHRAELLSIPGYSAVDVELVDEPVILPAFNGADAPPVTIVPPTQPIDERLPARISVEPADVPPPAPAPDTAVPPTVEAAAPLEVNVSAFWSDEDVALLRAAGGSA